MPPLSLTEEIERLLIEAAEKTGKSHDEILQLCLEHGLEKILLESEIEMNQNQNAFELKI